jgi:uncharacterized protein (TIGR02186 family)
MRTALATLLLLLAAAVPCVGQTAAPEPGLRDRVVAALSQNRVAITAGFEGLEILVYGAIARADLRDDGALGVVVSIVGPSRPVMVRRKDRIAGLWINAEAVRLAQAPSFHAVASSGPLFDTISHTEDLRWRVTVGHALRQIEADRTQAPRERFLDAVVRLRRENGLYVTLPGGVSLEEGVLFRTRIPLPSNIVEGTYTAQVLLARERQVIDSFSTEIEVSKAGLGRLIYDTATQLPLVYGVASIVVALIAGLAAAEVFRYLRR